MPPTDGLDVPVLMPCSDECGLVVADGDQLVEAVAHRRRQPLRHALRQQGAGLVPGRPHHTAQHRVGRRENVFVAEASPAPAPTGTPCGRAAALRLRGTAPAVRRRRCRTCADAGTHRCAADARRPSAAGARRRGSGGLRAGGAEGLFARRGAQDIGGPAPRFWGGEPVPASACPSPPSRHRPAEDVDWERDDGGNRPAAKGQPLLELGPSNSNRAEEAP